MKDMRLLIWITQLGLSTALPLAGCILLAKYLQSHLGLGQWVLWVGIGLGVLCAIDGLLYNLKIILNMTKNNKEDPPPVSFNDHD